ncbi:MAG TPA: FAD binding domain-containing protein [Streptosporangiaceae bacterium]|nr:FAD binding domain-containing protein [Streptosporangiaceae bacterium]
MRFAAMRPAFHRPDSVAGVCELLAADRRAIPYAGGTAIEIRRRRDPVFDSVLVDLSRVPCLDRLGRLDRLDRLDRLGSEGTDSGGLRVGPMVTIRRMASDPLVAEVAPLAAAAYAAVSNPPARNAATVGGSLAQGADRFDPPAALLVLGAVIEVMSIRSVRRVPVADFFVSGRRTVLEPGDLVTAIEIPAAPPGSTASYVRRCCPGEPDWPCASAAVRLVRGDGHQRLRLGIGALGDVPGLAELDLAGKREDRAVQAALDAAEPLMHPVPGTRGSVAGHRALARAAVEDAVHRAWRSR